MSLRSLQIIDSLGMGGAETWLMEVLRLWSRNGTAHMDFVATSGRPGVFDEEARALGATIHYIRYGRTNMKAFARDFRKVLREGHYDAMHNHQDFASGWHFLIGSGVLPPVRITHVHNPAYQMHNNYGVTFTRRCVAKAGKALVAQYATHIRGTSHQVINEYGFGGPAFRHISIGASYCGFEVARFKNDATDVRTSILEEFQWPPDALVVLFVGRIDSSPDPRHPQAHKNAGFAVDVAVAAARRDPRTRLLLAGALSPAVPLLQRRIADAGLAGNIRFIGVRRDVERLMSGANVLLFPSRGEGLGMAAVEAQAAGLPILASDAVPREAEVIPELIHFKSLNSGAESWAETLLALTKQPRYPGANEIVAASPFSIDNSAKALELLYASKVECQ